jgi:predicted transcriptional regulator
MEVLSNAPEEETDELAQKQCTEQREALRQECMAAHEHFKQTGLHLTHEEVKAWLRKLETGKYVAPPECHG